jgi:hypothetical protein
MWPEGDELLTSAHHPRRSRVYPWKTRTEEDEHMKRVSVTLAAVAAISFAAAGCSGGHPSAASSDGTGAKPAPANPFSHATEIVHGNITIPATSSPPGPFNITPLYCGPFTTAEQNQFGTSASGGLIYRYTNASAVFTGWPQVTVNFTKGSTVVASNVTGSDAPSLSSEQNAEAEVDAINGQPFTGCTITQYLTVSSSGTGLGSVYPG